MTGCGQSPVLRSQQADEVVDAALVETGERGLGQLEQPFEVACEHRWPEHGHERCRTRRTPGGAVTVRVRAGARSRSGLAQRLVDPLRAAGALLQVVGPAEVHRTAAPVPAETTDTMEWIRTDPGDTCGAGTRSVPSPVSRCWNTCFMPRSSARSRTAPRISRRLGEPPCGPPQPPPWIIARSSPDWRSRWLMVAREDPIAGRNALWLRARSGTLGAVTFYIVGTGGFGRETLDAALAAGIEVTAFLDEYIRGTCRGLPVLHLDDAEETASFAIGIAAPQVRARLAGQLTHRGLRPASILHPRAEVGPDTVLGAGCVILTNAYISSSCVIRSHVQVNYNATVGHDAQLGDFTTVLPGANLSGAVVVGDSATIGTNACVLPGRTVERGATVGAGAVVTRDVQPEVTVAGVPARPLA